MKEKLIELLCYGTAKTETCVLHEDCRTDIGGCRFCVIMADHLIANGVTVREKGEWKHAYVERGYFTAGGNRPWVCSECNGEVIRQTDYCPNCGADMR